MSTQQPLAARTKPKRFKKTPSRFSTKGGLLLLLTVPIFCAIAISLARGNFTGVLSNVTAAGLFIAGVISARRGFVQEDKYRAKKVALPPKAPLKLIGAAMIAAGTFVTAYGGAEHSLMIALCFAGGALLGFYLVYGFDPRAEKVVPAGSHGYTTEEVVVALEEAERLVERIDSANREIHNKELNRRLSGITELARKILAVIEDDPRDLRRARKFLNTYLEGAQRVTEGYARTHKKVQSDSLAQNFRNVLVTIEDVFREQYEKLLENDVLDLDVQIEVLATQLEREGVV